MAIDNDEQKNRAAARSAAASRLRKQHRTEYDGYLAEEMNARDIDWTPRPSPEDKAKKELEKIYAEYPHLKDSAPADDIDG